MWEKLWGSLPPRFSRWAFAMAVAAMFIFVVAAMFIFVGIVAGSVFEIFDDPRSATTGLIYNYQNYFAGILALFAGVITAIGVFLSAKAPIWEARNRLRKKAQRDEFIGASILFYEVRQVRAALEIALIRQDQANRLPIPPNDFTKIPVTEQMRSFEMISTQSDEVGRHLANLLAQLAVVNAFDGTETMGAGFREERTNWLHKAANTAEELSRMLKPISLVKD